jgi:hypothetical protein
MGPRSAERQQHRIPQGLSGLLALGTVRLAESLCRAADAQPHSNPKSYLSLRSYLTDRQ